MAGGHAWQGGMCGRGRACMPGHMCGKGRHVCGRGVCMAGGHVWQERQPLQRTVCILLECILVMEVRRTESVQEEIVDETQTTTPIQALIAFRNETKHLPN